MKSQHLRSFWVALAFAFYTAGQTYAQEPVDLEKYKAEAAEKWRADIKAFGVANDGLSQSTDAILFVGSSSFRRWEDMGKDMLPYLSINRGFGGSKWSDVAIFADQLISPHQFRAIVFFVANDIGGKGKDKAPEEVAALAAYVRKKVKEHQPEAAAFFIATTPTEKRWEHWPKIKLANNAVRNFCESTENTWFIGTESIFFDKKNKPRSELFVDDKLHMNEDGYTRWAAAIKSHLDSVLVDDRRQ
jgi:lysophospholipase L1-like esterase